MTAIFSSAEDAARTVSDIIRSKVIPTTLEFLDRNTLACVKGNLEMELPVNAGAMLLIEIDGDNLVLDRQEGRIKEACLKNGADEFNVAADKVEADNLWKARRGHHPQCSSSGRER